MFDHNRLDIKLKKKNLQSQTDSTFFIVQTTLLMTTNFVRVFEQSFITKKHVWRHFRA